MLLSVSFEVTRTAAIVVCVHCYLAIAVRMSVGFRCGGRTRVASCISPSRTVAGLVDFCRNVFSDMNGWLCHLAVSIEAGSLAVVSTLIGYERRWVCIVEMTSVVV